MQSNVYALSSCQFPAYLKEGSQIFREEEELGERGKWRERMQNIMLQACIARKRGESTILFRRTLSMGAAFCLA